MYDAVVGLYPRRAHLLHGRTSITERIHHSPTGAQVAALPVSG